jgi:hypothetical protein
MLSSLKNKTKQNPTTCQGWWRCYNFSYSGRLGELRFEAKWEKSETPSQKNKQRVVTIQLQGGIGRKIMVQDQPQTKT